MKFRIVEKTKIKPVLTSAGLVDRVVVIYQLQKQDCFLFPYILASYLDYETYDEAYNAAQLIKKNNKLLKKPIYHKLKP